MASDGSVPESRKEVLQQRAFLKIEAAVTAQKVQVHDRMQRPRLRMAIGARRAAAYLTGWVTDGEYLFAAMVCERVLRRQKRHGISWIEEVDHRYCKG
jgi:hypothetical protein